MTPKSLIVLAAATAVAVGAAAVSLNANRGDSDIAMSGAVFPGLIDHVNDVAKVTIEHRDRSLTMVRDAAGKWIMKESDDYPVSAKVAEKVVVQMADLNFYELKTKKPDLYTRLHVGDPKAEKAEARKIKVYDQAGKVLADVIAGRKRYNLVGSRREGVYIRKPDNAQTWLAAGEFDVEVKPGDWLEPKIVDIKEETVLSATLRHPDGEVVRVSKEDPKARNFTLHDVPAGKKLQYDTDPNNIAGVVDQLELDDARKDGYVAFDADKTLTAEYVTRDGLKLDIELRAKDGSDWARVKASALPDAPAPKDGAKSAADRAAEINARVSGWVYALPSFKATRLKRRMADMLKDDKPAS
jgi:hypothetical protein